MSKEDTNNSVNIVVLIEEYKSGRLNGNYLDGFGDFIVPNRMIEIRDVLNREKKGKIESNYDWDTRINDIYVNALASTDFEMFNLGVVKKHITYSEIMNYLSGAVASDLDKIEESKSSYLAADDTFTQAWVDEMLRASLRGLRRAKCTISGLPEHYQNWYYSKKQNEKKEDGAENKNGNAEDDSDKGVIKPKKSFSRLEKIVLIGFSAVFIALGINKGIDFYVLNQAKQEAKQTLNQIKEEAKYAVKQKEIEWEMKLNAVPYRAVEVIENIADKCIKNCYSDIDTSLPLEKKWSLLCMKLKQEGRQEFIKEKEDLKIEAKNEIRYELNNIKNEEIRKFAEKFFGAVLDEQNK